jgi:superfamily II RNA helicase
VVSLRGEIPRLRGVDHLAPPPELSLKPGQSRKGDDATLAIAHQIPLPEPLEESAPEVYAQQKRLEAVEAQAMAHPVHQWGNRGHLQKRQKRIQGIQAELSDRRTKLNEQIHRHWDEFVSLITILQAFDCLDDLVPTELGQATAAIRGDNELWLGLAMMSGELDGLDPHHLAAACAALVTEVSRPDSWTRYRLSGEVEEALGGLRNIRRRLFQLQRRHNVAAPVWLEYDLVALVEQWALGVDWLELVGNTSLDEGDVVRILRRTLDILSQIPYVPHAAQSLKENARRATQLCDRFPVNEVVA